VAVNNVDEQVAKFATLRPRYETFAEKLDHLVRSLLDVNMVKYQIVESRAKTLDSFREKITRSGKSYNDAVSELPDLCGSRVIVYYADDVVKVADIIKAEFDVVEEELAHQQDAIDVDRFGYLSAHYVIKLGAGRRNLAEWGSAKDLRAEIQIRTVIQHAWSAVSHALQYKQEVAVPSRLRRRLHRIAGLFELADEEFVGIRDQRQEIERVTLEALAIGNKAIPLTTTSIIQMIKKWEYLGEASRAARSAGFGLSRIIDEDGTIAEIYELAHRAGIEDIESLEAAVSPPDYSSYRKISMRLTESWTVTIDFLFFFLLADRYSSKLKYEDLIDFGWGNDKAEKLIRAISKRS
jgi:putative GTP pyrophosphokinase